jgi:hypothetical protein
MFNFCVGSALETLCRVDFEGTTDVSEVYAAPVFRVEVSVVLIPVECVRHGHWKNLASWTLLTEASPTPVRPQHASYPHPANTQGQNQHQQWTAAHAWYEQVDHFIYRKEIILKVLCTGSVYLTKLHYVLKLLGNRHWHTCTSVCCVSQWCLYKGTGRRLSGLSGALRLVSSWKPIIACTGTKRPPGLQNTGFY